MRFRSSAGMSSNQYNSPTSSVLHSKLFRHWPCIQHACTTNLYFPAIGPFWRSERSEQWTRARAGPPWDCGESASWVQIQAVRLCSPSINHVRDMHELQEYVPYRCSACMGLYIVYTAAQLQQVPHSSFFVSRRALTLELVTIASCCFPSCGRQHLLPNTSRLYM